MPKQTSLRSTCLLISEIVWNCSNIELERTFPKPLHYLVCEAVCACEQCNCFFISVKQCEKVSYYSSTGPGFYVTESLPLFHSGHISNIRCLSRVEPSSAFVLSGGGRGMLAVWRLDDGADVPGLMGWVRLDTSVADGFDLPNCPVQGAHRRPKSAVDLRIMTLLGFKRESVDVLMILAGCSDGSLRWVPHYFKLVLITGMYIWV